MSSIDEPPSRSSLEHRLTIRSPFESREPFDNRLLALTDEVTEALKALARFAEESPSADFWGRPGEPAEGTVGPHTVLVALASATAVVQSSMPSCPYAPPGIPVEIQYLPPNNKLVQRCRHVNPAHCWEGYGSIPYKC